jgi:methyl-accepting chemotaxis protein
MSEDLMIVQNLIYEVRGQKVMLDSDLARLYGIETRELKQAVRRNIKRFPADFMIELDIEEYNAMIACSRSQIVTLNKKGRGFNVKYRPFVFTELGVAMLSSILKSETAIQVNIGIMRAFSQVRQYLLSASTVPAELKELRAKVDLLAMQQEENLGALNDLSEDVRQDIDNLYTAIGELSSRIEEKKHEPQRKIGFQ